MPDSQPRTRNAGSEAEHAPPSAIDFSKRIPELDGLRGLAILLVLIFHYAVIPLYNQTGIGFLTFESAARLTWTGVDLFFVLSGFLIGGILIDARESPRYFKVFYIRRFYRIIPIYAVFCIFIWVTERMSFPNHVPGLQWVYHREIPWYSYATLTQNLWVWRGIRFGSNALAPTWSLAVEEQFYLTIPLLIWLVRKSRLPYFLVSLILLAPLLRMFLYLIDPTTALSASFLLTPCRADSLVLGVLSALLLRKPEVQKGLATHVRTLNFSLLVLFLGIVFILWKTGAHPFSKAMTFGGYSWMALFYLCLLLITVTHKNHIFSRMMRNRLLMRLGTIAYGTYLLHQTVLGFCFAFLRAHKPQINNFGDGMISLLALALTFVLASISWTYFERPIVKMSHAHKY